METELKTLKDMKCYCELCAFSEEHEEEDILIKKVELKAEAINLLKDKQKLARWILENQKLGELSHETFIRVWNNLTPEDLQEVN